MVAARMLQPFADVQDVKTRAMLDEKDMNALAQADAFRFLAGHRRDALWKTLGTELQAPLLKNVAREERQASLLPPTEGQDVLADYKRVGLTLRSHPLKLLRPTLSKMRLKTSEEIRRARPGQLIRTTGIVINRQRPDTDSGVTFATLEDELGLINVTVWKTVAERNLVALTQAQLLTVYGTIERDATTVFVVAGRLVNHSALLGGLSTSSRDFH